MEWFIAALISAFFMALAWLTLKKAQEKGLDSTYSLAIFFIISIVSLIIWQIANKISFQIPSLNTSLFIIGISCLPIVSNLLVMSAFERSPNPGLVLALNSTQILWLFWAGTIIFGATFSVISFTGVFLVFAGVASLQQQSKSADLRWIFYGLLTGVIGAVYLILLKKLQMTIPNIPLTTLFIYIVLPAIPVYLLVGKYKKKEFKVSKSIFSILTFSGLVGTIANIASFFAITTAPNIGYAQATVSSGALLALLMAPFFSANATLRLKDLLSAFLIIAGVVILRLVS